jgi:hypothetical protein
MNARSVSAAGPLMSHLEHTDLRQNRDESGQQMSVDSRFSAVSGRRDPCRVQLVPFLQMCFSRSSRIQAP